MKVLPLSNLFTDDALILDEAMHEEKKLKYSASETSLSNLEFFLIKMILFSHLKFISFMENPLTVTNGL